MTTTTKHQTTEQEIANRSTVGDIIVSNALKEYEDMNGEKPTAKQLSWFIFEYKGIRVDVEDVQQLMQP